MPQKFRLYLIPGLGADARIFQFLELDPMEYEILEWIQQKDSESLDSYVDRFAKGIDFSAPVRIIGVSFGGICAIEIAKRFAVEQVILISSIKNQNELPANLKFISKFGLQYLIPGGLYKKIRVAAVAYFGTTTYLGKQKLKEVLKDLDISFTKWAVGRIGQWRNEVSIPGIKHIHGTDDKVFPIKKLENVIPIKGAQHFMVVERAEEISILLHQLLE